LWCLRIATVLLVAVADGLSPFLESSFNGKFGTRSLDEGLTYHVNGLGRE
jgi:hypothetical protein